MAEIPESGAIPPVGGAEQGGQGGARRRQRESAPPESRPRTASEIADTASVLGIPPEELTPRVEEALTKILGEFDRQRAELDHIKAHETYLEAEADHHAYLPVPNRRAFHSALARMLARAEQSETRSSFALIVVRNLHVVRARHGLRAAEAALAHVADSLQSSIRASDLVGSLGGNDLGVILTLTDKAEAAAKAAEIVARIGAMLFVWDGQRIDLEIAAGVETLAPGATVDTVIEGADRALREAAPDESEDAPD